LFDAYYDNSHPPEDQPAGLKESDITKADAIFVGHTHFDHFLDAPAIAKRTGAPIYLGPPGLNYLHAQAVPENQIKIVRGGETFKRDGYTVQTALAIHMVVPPKESAAYSELIAKANPLPADKLKWITEGAKSPTPDVVIDPLDPDTDTIYHGTIVYVLTFDNGFRILFSDSDGNLSNGEHALADSIHAAGGKIDVAILGYLGDTTNTAIRTTLTRVKVWNPSIFVPSHHHNGDSRILPEMPTAPLFEAFREQAPDTKGVAPLYRSPICVNTKTDDVFVGNYVH
jgi:L-ascorbate metabolism protein UlaG (beta-lactamase superfamily)